MVIWELPNGTEKSAYTVVYILSPGKTAKMLKIQQFGEFVHLIHNLQAGFALALFALTSTLVL